MISGKRNPSILLQSQSFFEIEFSESIVTGAQGS